MHKGSGVVQTLYFHLKWSLGPDVPVKGAKKIAQKKSQIRQKLPYLIKASKFLKMEKNFIIKNNFFARFSFSKLVSSSKRKKVTAKTKISKKRQNANFGPPKLNNRVPTSKKSPVLARIMTNRMRGSIFVQIGFVQIPGLLILRENDS